ncbi:MAG: zinc metalloprotease ywhC [Patescibacteria group bacterium]|nr:zinc metalloprotease ywhC [Patescibacteria group bacterium]
MELIAQLVALIFGLTLHEFAHALMGHHLGDTTAKEHGRLTLNPLAHIDPIATLLLPLLLIFAHSPVVFAAAKPVPFNPWALRGGRWGAAAVAAAGPGTNFLIAGFFALWAHIVPYNPTAALFYGAIIVVNVGLGVFNLIPFPPLDGSRVLYAVAPESVRDVMDRIERAGFVVLLLVMLLGYQFIAPVVAKITIAIVQLLVPSGPLP